VRNVAGGDRAIGFPKAIFEYLHVEIKRASCGVAEGC
jgi:hypothetical protein